MAQRNCKNCGQPRTAHRLQGDPARPGACQRYKERPIKASERRVADLQAFWVSEHPQGPNESYVDYVKRMPQRLELRG